MIDNNDVLFHVRSQVIHKNELSPKRIILRIVNKSLIRASRVKLVLVKVNMVKKNYRKG